MDLKEIRLVLMRHGSTVWNKQKRYLGHTDLGLCPQGYKELEPARDKLKGMTLDAVLCSDLKRCRETLKAVRQDLAAEAAYDSALREMDFGAWEGHTYDELKEIPHYRQWLDDPQHITPPGGEGWESFDRRISGYLKSLLYSMEKTHADPSSNSESVLVVSHGGVIRHIVSSLVRDKGFWDTRVEPGNLLMLTLRQDAEAGWSGDEMRLI